jgi:hypothetical protein
MTTRLAEVSRTSELPTWDYLGLIDFSHALTTSN